MDFNPIMIAAGAEILRIYATDFAVERKDDASPVTDADSAAEKIILEGLARIAPDIPVIAEEEAAAGRIPEIGNRFFLVDPLDGTKEFISRNGEFTVNIALIENGEPIRGAVYAPALGKLYWGARGEGAYVAAVVNGTLSPSRPIGVRLAPPEGLTAIGSRSHGSAETQDYLKAYHVNTFVAAGSSLKFCLVAEGTADIYPRLAPTMQWDTAAGDAVLRAAGGRVETLDGESLAYGAGPANFRNPFFVAFGFDTR